MLDTNTCIYLIQGTKDRPRRELTRRSPEEISISSITLAELAYEVEKSQRVHQNREALERFLLPLEIRPFDASAARELGRIRAKLEKKGRPIGTYDMMIGAHAVAEDAILVTNNEREFRRVEGLRIENWARE